VKKDRILHKELNKALSSLGHYDTIIVCDAGLPIPKEEQRIELAIKPGVPSFVDVIEAIMEDLEVEKVYVAEEVKSISPDMSKEHERIFKNMDVEHVPHSRFKEMSKECKVIVRTGEYTKFSSALLVCGCAY
jgi:D-ribose pyranase